VSDDSDIEQVMRLLTEVSALLAGRPRHVQGAVLADLLAMWLAGHINARDRGATQTLREEVLAKQLQTVRELIPVNAKAIGAPW
jgi:hemerythrin